VVAGFWRGDRQVKAQFFPADGDLVRGSESEPNLVPTHGDSRHANMVANQHLFTHLAAKNQHSSPPCVKFPTEQAAHPVANVLVLAVRGFLIPACCGSDHLDLIADLRHSLRSRHQGLGDLFEIVRGQASAQDQSPFLLLTGNVP
jgi:hypothetical protein